MLRNGRPGQNSSPTTSMILVSNRYSAYFGSESSRPTGLNEDLCRSKSNTSYTLTFFLPVEVLDSGTTTISTTPESETAVGIETSPTARPFDGRLTGAIHIDLIIRPCSQNFQPLSWGSGVQPLRYTSSLGEIIPPPVL